MLGKWLVNLRLAILVVLAALWAGWLAGSGHLPAVGPWGLLLVYGLTWSPVKNWTSVLVSVDDLNTQIRDNMSVLKTSIADDGTLASTGGVLSKPRLKNFTEPPNAVSIAAGVLTLDLSLGAEFSVSLNQNITSIVFTNVPSATDINGVTIAFIADGTVRTVAWPPSTQWGGGVPPTMTGTLNHIDFIYLRTYANWTSSNFGFIQGQDHH